MASSDARDMFDAYVDGELGADERAAFEAAVEADDSLRAELDDYSGTIHLLRDLPRSDAPDGFVWMVQQRVRRRTRGRYFGVQTGPNLVYEAATCAVLLCIMAGLYLFNASPPATEGGEAAESAHAEQRLTISPADRRFLSENGRIRLVGTSLTGDDLEVHIVINAATEEAFRRAVDSHPRFSVVPSSRAPAGRGVFLKLRTRGSPAAAGWGAD